MARYISQHTLACLTRQGAEELARRLHAARLPDGQAQGVAARRVLVNMVEGKMLVEFDAADRDTLEAWLKKEGFHYDWVLRIELESREGKLEPI